MKRLLILSILVTLVTLAGGFAAQRGPAAATPAPAGSATAKAMSAANAFLNGLDSAERAKAAFPFDSPQKTNWSNLPSGIYQRNSLRLGDLSPAKREAAFALLTAVLSSDGYRKVTDIMNGDEVLRGTGGGQTGGRAGGPGRGGARGGRGGQGPGGVTFGRDEYYIAVLGTPSVSSPWRVQFGGHHLAINVTLAGRDNAITPSLPAAQPATYTLNGQTIRPLGKENDKAFALMGALNAAQQKQAILNYRVSDLVLGAGEDGKTIQPEGILASALDANQQAMLLDLAHEWVGLLNDEGAAARMADIRGNLPRTYFAWSGPTQNGGLAYFRIQGPTVVIEYAPQQGDADHIHTIYRDPTNDYGARMVTP